MALFLYWIVISILMLKRYRIFFFLAKQAKRITRKYLSMKFYVFFSLLKKKEMKFTIFRISLFFWNNFLNEIPLKKRMMKDEIRWKFWNISNCIFFRKKFGKKLKFIENISKLFIGKFFFSKFSNFLFFVFFALLKCVFFKFDVFSFIRIIFFKIWLVF